MIFILGLSTIFWLMSVLAKPVDKVIVKKNDTQTLMVNKQDNLLVLPKNNSLLISVSNTGIDKKKFIESYKSNLKVLNNVKSKISLRFSFYQKQDHITSVEVLIKWQKPNSEKMIIQKHIITLFKNKE